MVLAQMITKIKSQDKKYKIQSTNPLNLSKRVMNVEEADLQDPTTHKSPTTVENKMEVNKGLHAVVEVLNDKKTVASRKQNQFRYMSVESHAVSKVVI